MSNAQRVEQPEAIFEAGTTSPGSLTFIYGADSVTLDPKQPRAEYERNKVAMDALIERMRDDVAAKRGWR